MQFLAVLLLACGIFGLAHCKDCKKALGMENGAIKDDQLTASSQLGERNAPSRARLNIEPALNKAGAWSPGRDDKTPWLQIDLKSRIIKVTRVATQGRKDSVQWVTKYKMQYSNSGSDFKTYKEKGKDKIFLGNEDQNTVVSHELSPPIRARFIRFLPISEFAYKSMRVEIYGCNETFQCPVCHATGVDAETRCNRNAKFEICNRNNAVCQLTKAAMAGNMQLEVTRKCTDMKSFMEEKEICRENPNCLHTTSCNTSRCMVTAPIAFQCQSCSHTFGKEASCTGFVTYKVCTKPMPACFVTQQLRGSFIQVSRGCGSEMEYKRAIFACRQGPERCPLIGRCDKNRCQAALPYYCGTFQKYMAKANFWTNEYSFGVWATLCMNN